jgi:hypothetical protein
MQAGILTIRIFRDDNGAYSIRFLSKRKFKKNFPNWLGRSLSINIDTCREFINFLKIMEAALPELDRKRIAVKRAEQKARENIIYKIPQRRKEKGNDETDDKENDDTVESQAVIDISN